MILRYLRRLWWKVSDRLWPVLPPEPRQEGDFDTDAYLTRYMAGFERDESGETRR